MCYCTSGQWYNVLLHKWTVVELVILQTDSGIMCYCTNGQWYNVLLYKRYSGIMCYCTNGQWYNVLLYKRTVV